MMRDDLYFVPIIAAAMQNANQPSALSEAFARIRAMGSEPRYERGYRQLLEFVRSASAAGVEELDFETSAAILREFDRPDSIGVTIERDGGVVETCELEGFSGTRWVQGLVPGAYRVTLDTGRVLWAGVLEERDLVWAKAHPGEDLSLAADGGAQSTPPTRRFELLNGTVLLQVYAGLESGVLEIGLQAAGGQA